MQTGSSETLIGSKCGKTSYVSLSLYGTEWRERGYGLRRGCKVRKIGCRESEQERLPSEQKMLDSEKNKLTGCIYTYRVQVT